MLKKIMALLMIGVTSWTYAKTIDPADYLQKSLQLPRPMLLTETKQWNPLVYSGRWLFSFPEHAYTNNIVNMTIPSLSEYINDPKHWQAWQGNSFSGRARAVGMLAQGTAFHIKEVTPNQNNLGYWVTIEFDQGAYKGTTAMVANFRNVVG